MAIPDWETDIPTVPFAVQREDWTIEAAFGADSILSTDLTPAGTLRMRNLASQDTTIENVKIHVGVETQLYLFLFWVRNDLGRGTATFTMPVLYGGAWRKKRCQIVGGGNGISRNPLGWRAGGLTWMVSFKRKVEDLYTNA